MYDYAYLQAHFPALSEPDYMRLAAYHDALLDWNSRVNLISRVTATMVAPALIMQALALTKVYGFRPGLRVLDIGSGGGFPGMPLALVHPELSVTLNDSVQKKCRALTEMSKQLGASNVDVMRGRAETLPKGRWDLVVGQAVMRVDKFFRLAKPLLRCEDPPAGQRPNGLLYITGEDQLPHLPDIRASIREHWPLAQFLPHELPEAKHIVYLSGCAAA